MWCWILVSKNRPIIWYYQIAICNLYISLFTCEVDNSCKNDVMGVV